jgi:hypothetical protein
MYVCMYVAYLVYTQFWLAPDLPEYNLHKLGSVCIQKIEISGNLSVSELVDKPAYSLWQLIQVLKAWIISCAVNLLDIASKLFSISRCSIVIFILNVWECYSTSQYYISLTQSLVTTIRLEAKYIYRFIWTWFTIEQKIFKVFCINTQKITRFPHKWLIIGAVGSTCVWIFPASNFTKFFPLATNWSSFGWRTQIVQRSLYYRMCSAHDVYQLKGGHWKSFNFFMYSPLSVTSNSMSDCTPCDHRVCITLFKTCATTLSFQVVMEFDHYSYSKQHDIHPCTCKCCFICVHQNIVFPAQYSNFSS